jgi:uncharacterized protein with PQ loop repeat
MSFYTLFGGINTFFIFVSLYGVLSQLKTIWRRKIAEETKQESTALLSLNQFTVSFLAYFSFFIYGYSIEPFNHFIVWPRLIAAVLVLVILFELWRDRKNQSTLTVFVSALLFLALGILGLFFGESFVDEGRQMSTIIILIISFLIAQGYYHQIRLIIRSQNTGAVDLKMSQFILMMDISTIAFALSMELENSWPLIVLAITSAITKLIIMYLFKWVKITDQVKKVIN